MKIVITDRDTVTSGDLSLDSLERFGEVVSYGLTAPEQLIERIADADAVLCNKTQITAEVMDACPKLRYVGLFATGYNNIDVVHAAKKGITVCNAGEYSSDAVAQLTFAMLLELCTSLSRYSAYTASGGWVTSPVFSAFIHPQREIAGMTLGIVGCGSIGRRVARVAAAFGMKVLVYTRTPEKCPDMECVSFDELLSRSDAVTVHCPLTDATAGMFNAEAFGKMKQGAFFVNTSRGGVVNEPALREALDSGRLGGAALDVLAVEPMRADCPLLGAKNLIITPHVAWAPLETRQRLLGIVESNIEGWLKGEPRNVVS
ncbi:MAG: D-2-hydroxyacid dehydrogenase [Ruminococcaceae bacterium]|nr:D-2-hydroxyacid dehydrogenase [Oscillospiraceae bacterium]